MSQITGAEIVFKAFADHGVEYIFGYPGGAILPLYDELKNHKKIKHILVRHEQGAGHAAEGYARSSGKPGVVLVTSGPGATNMVTASSSSPSSFCPITFSSKQHLQWQILSAAQLFSSSYAENGSRSASSQNKLRSRWFQC